MTVKNVTEFDIGYEVNNAISNEKEILLYYIPQRTTTFYGYGNRYVDEIYCKNNDIFAVNLNNEGGTIVSDKNSLVIGHFSLNSNNTFNYDFSEYIVNWLKSKGLNVSKQNNDILVDDTYKVASFSTRKFGNILFSAFHISASVNINAINVLCKKQMVKIPKGLCDYNIPPNEIYSVFKSFLNYLK